MTTRSPKLRGRPRAFCLAFIASVALAGFATASASALSYQVAAGTTFTLSGGTHAVELATSEPFQCASSSTNGTVVNGTELQVNMTLQGCKYPNGVACTSPGKESGTIAFATMVGKLIYLDKIHSKFGLLFANPHAEFHCSTQSHVIGGSGWIAQITEPQANETSGHLALTFARSSFGHQLYTQVEEAGSSYYLTDNGREMAISGTDPGTLSGGATGTFVVGSSKLSYDAPSGTRFSTSGELYVFKSFVNEPFECERNVGSGAVASSTELEVQFTFLGCHTRSGISCTTSGQESGTMVFPNLVGKLVYLDKARSKFGLLFAPPASGVFGDVTCSFLAHIVVGGNGWIGQITKPALNEASGQLTLAFEIGATGHQLYRQVEEEGPFYNLTSSLNGGSFSELSVAGANSGALANGATATFSN